MSVITLNSSARALARALAALRTTSDSTTKLKYIAAGAAELATNRDALDQLSETAIHTHGLGPDAVQTAIARGIKRAPPAKEPPRPLMRELPPADPFPVDALGSLAAAARAIHERTQAPLATCGQSVLAAATLAVQGLADVELPTRQVRPVSCFFVTIAGTGERKTSVDTEALRPIRRQESDLREEYTELSLSYQNDLTAWEKAKEAAIKKGGKDRSAIKAALDAMGEKPTAPALPVLTVDDPTYEGLCKLFAGSRPSLGVFSSEGGQMIGGHSMAEDAKLRTAAGLSKLWDGDAIKRVRADGSSILPGRRLSMHLMCQPDVAGGWLGDALLADQGLLSRVLVSAPDSTAGTRFWREWNGSAALTDYDHTLFGLIRQPLSLDAVGGVHPRALVLSSAARREWITFYDATEAKMRPGSDFDPIRGLANKLAEHATRLAAVLTMVADPDAVEVSAEAMGCGIELARHYAAEALRLCQSGVDDPDLRLAKQTLAWMCARGDSMFHMRELYRLGPAPIREKATATKIVKLLADHGWLEPVAGGAELDGAWRKEVYRLVTEE